MADIFGIDVPLEINGTTDTETLARAGGDMAQEICENVNNFIFHTYYFEGDEDNDYDKASAFIDEVGLDSEDYDVLEAQMKELFDNSPEDGPMLQWYNENYIEWEEFLKYVKFLNELNISYDLEYGEIVIGEGHTADYAEEFCTDCGFISRDMPSWISTNINWDGVWEDLSVDYINADYSGKSGWGKYYTRSV